MSEELLIKYCAPTLASLKTGNLFSCRFENREDLQFYIRNLNLKLRDKGLRLLPLRQDEGRALIYLYRPCRLYRDLENEAARRLLEECGCGYDCNYPERCLVCLSRRLREQSDFPHEIGLFLGYPPEDVEGFIRCKKPKYTGCWKVYGDAESAKRTFARYKKCTDVYLRQWTQGKAIEKLAVTERKKNTSVA